MTPGIAGKDCSGVRTGLTGSDQVTPPRVLGYRRPGRIAHPTGLPGGGRLWVSVGMAGGRLTAARPPAGSPGSRPARVGVTPLGLGRPPVHLLLYGHGAPRGFGRAKTLRCPHYRADAGGACGIWRHRNAVCATWFCKHVRGGTGQRFWRSLEQLLSIAERELSRYCLLQVDVEAEMLARLL